MTILLVIRIICVIINGFHIRRSHVGVGTYITFGCLHTNECICQVCELKSVGRTCIRHRSIPVIHIASLDLLSVGLEDILSCICSCSGNERKGLICQNCFVVCCVCCGSSEQTQNTFTSICHCLIGSEIVVSDGAALESELLSGAEFSKPCTLCLGEGSVEGCSGSGAGSRSAGSVIQCVLRFGDGCGQRHAERGGLHTDFLFSHKVVHQRLKVGLERGGIVDGSLKQALGNVGTYQPS